VANEMSTAAISAQSLAVFRGSQKVIRSLDLQIYPGEWFGVIGANGSGKTSLLRAISGRLPIHSGSCLINGQEMQANRFQRAEAIELAPTQNTIPKSLTTRQIFDLVHKGWETNLGDLYDVLGLSEFVDKPTSSYSAGMKQRTAIACAFLRGKKTVILDEPFNWLDPVAAYDLRAVLREWVSPERCLITALHDTGTLVMSCDRGALLARGAVRVKLDPIQLEEAQENVAAFEAEMILELRDS